MCYRPAATTFVQNPLRKTSPSSASIVQLAKDWGDGANITQRLAGRTLSDQAPAKVVVDASGGIGTIVAIRKTCLE
jgi:hypothetical protein